MRNLDIYFDPRSKEYALHLLKDSGKTEKWMKENWEGRIIPKRQWNML